MRETNAESNILPNELEKEAETSFEKLPQWGDNTSVTYRQTSRGNRFRTYASIHSSSTSSSSSPSSSKSSSSSSLSLSSQLSTYENSYERLSTGTSSNADHDSTSEMTYNQLSTSCLQESLATAASLPSPCSSHSCLYGGEDDQGGVTFHDGIRDENLLDDLGVDQPREDLTNQMIVEHVYIPSSDGTMTEDLPPAITSSPFLLSSRALSLAHSKTSSPPSTTSSTDVSNMPSSSLYEPSSTDESSSSPLSLSKAPWMLVVWCHLSQILAGGLLKSLAVFLDDILEEFDSSVAFMGWMFSLEAFFFGLTCPFASFATKKLGPRVVMMVGGLINGAGIFMASLATNIIVVGLGISAIAGSGSSMIYVAALVTVRRNFHTFYAVANGLTLAGVSVAVFTFPPIIRVLIEHFGWRGALSILSAMSLNTMVTGALMKDAGRVRKTKRSSVDKGETKPFVSESCNTRKAEESGGHEETNNVSCTFRKNGVPKTGGSSTVVTFQNVDGSHVNYFEEDYSSSSCKMGIRSVYIDGEITSVPVQMNSQGRPYRRPSIGEKYVKLIVANITHGLLGMVAFLWSMSNTATMKYLAAAGVERGLTSIEAAMLLSATGIAQCLTLFVNGTIISKGWITPLQLYLIAFLLMAGAGFGIAIFQLYVVGLVCSALFGLGTGTIISLNLVVQRTLDPRAGAQAAGWLMFIEGVAGCIGGFCIGAVRDMSGSYTVSFLVSCAVTSLGTCLVVVILIIRRVRRGH